MKYVVCLGNGQPSDERIIYRGIPLYVTDVDGVVSLWNGKEKVLGYSEELDVAVAHTDITVGIYKYIKSVYTLRRRGAYKVSPVYFHTWNVRISGVKGSVVKMFNFISGEFKYLSLFDFLVVCCRAYSNVFSTDVIMFSPPTHREIDATFVELETSREARAYFSKLELLSRGMI